MYAKKHKEILVFEGEDGMRLILSSIGTSLLTHKANDVERALLNKYANSSYEEIPDSDLKVLNQLIERAKAKLSNRDFSEVQKLSAELNGILSYYQNNLNKSNNDYHLLIVTDTYEGKETAGLVKNFLTEYNVMVESKVIEGLKTDNTQSFTDGVKKLIAFLFENIQGYQEVVFNLTGGFKAIQAYLNTIGMFLADKLIYLFETGTLINIPALPVKFDNYDLLKKHSAIFAMMDKGRSLYCKKIPDVFWADVSEIYYDKVSLDNEEIISQSAWAMLMWNKQKDAILNQDLLDFPNIEYTSLFRENFLNCNNKDRLMIQECLSNLASLYLENNQLMLIKQHGGLQYSDYSSIKFGKYKLGHFRVNQSRRINSFEFKNKLYLLEYGEHSIENNLERYQNVIHRITNEKI